MATEVRAVLLREPGALADGLAEVTEDAPREEPEEEAVDEACATTGKLLMSACSAAVAAADADEGANAVAEEGVGEGVDESVGVGSDAGASAACAAGAAKARPTTTAARADSAWPRACAPIAPSPESFAADGKRGAGWTMCSRHGSKWWAMHQVRWRAKWIMACPWASALAAWDGVAWRGVLGQVGGSASKRQGHPLALSGQGWARELLQFGVLRPHAHHLGQGQVLGHARLQHAAGQVHRVDQQHPVTRA